MLQRLANHKRGQVRTVDGAAESAYTTSDALDRGLTAVKAAAPFPLRVRSKGCWAAPHRQPAARRCST